MATGRTARFSIIAVLLVLGSAWALASAKQSAEDYPGGRFLASPRWLQEHLADPGLTILDVRTDKDFDGRLIPGAVRLPWTAFRYDDPARGLGELFVGTARAQEILGTHGVGRDDTVVLYDSVKKDGGATASYLFWILDLLGHERMRVLERGIDGWADAGGSVVATPRDPVATVYQARGSQVRLDRQVDAAFLLARLGDPHYQVLDVRSREEYLGEKASSGLAGEPLKAGHIPTAVNADYRSNWIDPDSKAIRPYAQLRELYRGLDPGKTVVTYCQSGRRASFGYFILRLMGLERVSLYDESWFEWGNRRTFLPVETEENRFSGGSLPSPLHKASVQPGAPSPQKTPAPGGYVSCGG